MVLRSSLGGTACLLIVALCTSPASCDSPTIYNGLPWQQIEVLNNMFDKKSRNSLNWVMSIPPCSRYSAGWTGVTCNQDQTGIVSLQLANMEIGGTLPDMTNLVDLLSMTLTGNAISGTIPEGLPPFIRTIELSANFFKGTIPQSLSRMSNMRVLDLSANVLTGGIPPLGALTRLSYLIVGNNHLDGSFPTGTEKMPMLQAVSMFGNRLSGSLPPHLGDAKVNPLLSFLYVYGNRFSGKIPGCLTSAPNLARLYLDTNSFTGVIPQFRNAFPHGALQRITLANNKWSCPLPKINPSVWQDREDTNCSGGFTFPLWVLIGACAAGGLFILSVLVYIFRDFLARTLCCCTCRSDAEDPEGKQSGSPVGVATTNDFAFDRRSVGPGGLTSSGHDSLAGTHNSTMSAAIIAAAERNDRGSGEGSPLMSQHPSSCAIPVKHGINSSVSARPKSLDPTVSLFASVTSHMFAETQPESPGAIDRSLGHARTPLGSEVDALRGFGALTSSGEQHLGDPNTDPALRTRSSSWMKKKSG